jgi:gamma-glutamylputrescine oxidase
MKNSGHPDSWYTATADLPAYPSVSECLTTDVAIIGGGYTGLGAALELATRGYDVTVLEGAQIGSGASGRNGGQIHTGQRVDPISLQDQFGADFARQLWEMAEDAKQHLLNLITEHKIDCELKLGLIHAWHKPKFKSEDQAYVDFIRSAHGYDNVGFLTRGEVAQKLGTDVYFGGSIDAAGGHLHPLKFVIGMARAAHAAGARLFQNSQVRRYDRRQGGIVLSLANGCTVRAQKLLICGNGYMEGLSDAIDTHVMPINNFILTTAPLSDLSVLPDDEAASDSRFVVNYWRRTPDNRLLFGGGENYVPWFPKDLKNFVRKNMLKVYPQLKDTEISFAWGGTLGITMSRAPFVRQLHPGVFVSAGYSGQGVMLAPYFGKLLAMAATGGTKDIELLGRLPTPAFFGGRALRWPALVTGLSYYALRDRLS